MCRMLAKISVHEESVREELVEAVRSLRTQSVCGCVPAGDPPGHTDGCGLAFVRGGNIEIVRRGREDAWNDTFLETARSVRSQLAIGHNRKASSGLTAANVGPDFAHPF